ncbi:MAG: hypothetical protein Q9169_004514 [Polycauliona sp. 2 TL-2023]
MGLNFLGMQYGVKKEKSGHHTGFTRKRPGQKSGSDDYQPPSHKASLRPPQYNEPVYMQHEKAGFCEEPDDYSDEEAEYGNHPSRMQPPPPRYVDPPVQYSQRPPQFDDGPRQYQRQETQHRRHSSRVLDHYPVQQQQERFYDRPPPPQDHSVYLSRRQTVSHRPDHREQTSAEAPHEPAGVADHLQSRTEKPVIPSSTRVIDLNTRSNGPNKEATDLLLRTKAESGALSKLPITRHAMITAQDSIPLSETLHLERVILDRQNSGV